MKSMTNVTRLLSFILFLSLIGFVSCQKESSTGSQSQNEQFGQAASASDAESEAMFDDVFDNVMGVNTEVGIGGTGVFAQPAPQVPGEEIISGANHVDSMNWILVPDALEEMDLPVKGRSSPRTLTDY